MSAMTAVRCDCGEDTVDWVEFVASLKEATESGLNCVIMPE